VHFSTDAKVIDALLEAVGYPCDRDVEALLERILARVR
jgi:hypothetical protein